MRWFIIMHGYSLLLELNAVTKDLQSLLLGRQLEIVLRKLDKPLRVSHTEKFFLAVLTLYLKRTTGQSVKELSEVMFDAIFATEQSKSFVYLFAHQMPMLKLHAGFVPSVKNVSTIS